MSDGIDVKIYTPEIRKSLEEYLHTHTLPRGIGNEESACSIAAINLAMTGRLTDDIPDCMSKVLGEATIRLQDTMPADMRNSARYKAWLPDAVGTGREREQERLDILLDWMWRTLLPEVQSFADAKGFGDEWRAMCVDRTKAAADAAVNAAYDANGNDAAKAAVYASYVAYASNASNASCADAYAVYASNAAESVYTVYTEANAEDTDFWRRVDFIGVLERMTYLEDET